MKLKLILLIWAVAASACVVFWLGSRALSALAGPLPGSGAHPQTRIPDPASSHPPTVATSVARARSRRERTVHGLVIDGNGDPVVEAQVSATWPGIGREPPATRTGTDGWFKLKVPVLRPRNADEWGIPWIHVRAEGYVSRRARGGVVSGDMRFTMRRAATVRIRVVGPTGEPVAGAAVTVNCPTFSFGELSAEVTTDTAGTAVVEDRFPAHAAVTATARRDDGRPAVTGSAWNHARGSTVELRFDADRLVYVTVETTGLQAPVAALQHGANGVVEGWLAWPGGQEADVRLPRTVRQIRAVTTVGPSPWIDVPGDVRAVPLPVDTSAARQVKIVTSTTGDARVRGMFGLFGGTDARFGGLDLARLDTGDGYMLPVGPDGIYAVHVGSRKRLLHGGSPDVLDMDEHPFRYQVRMEVALEDGKPPPVGDAVAVLRPQVEGAPTDKVCARRDEGGAFLLDLLPGLPYRIAVSAPGQAPVSIDHVARASDRTLRVKLVAAPRPARLLLHGAVTRGRVAVLSFPSLEQVSRETDERGISLVPRGPESWALALTDEAWYLLSPRALASEEPVSLPSLPPTDVRWEPGDDARHHRVFVTLFGIDPVAPGVHAVAQLRPGRAFPPPPPGRYLPVEVRGDQVIVHRIVTLDDTPAVLELPAASDPAVDWSRGVAAGDTVCDLFVTVLSTTGDEVEIPVRRLRPGRERRWRTAGPTVRQAPVSRNSGSGE